MVPLPHSKLCAVLYLRRTFTLDVCQTRAGSRFSSWETEIRDLNVTLGEPIHAPSDFSAAERIQTALADMKVSDGAASDPDDHVVQDPEDPSAQDSEAFMRLFDESPQPRDDASPSTSSAPSHEPNCNRDASQVPPPPPSPGPSKSTQHNRNHGKDRKRRRRGGEHFLSLTANERSTANPQVLRRRPQEPHRRAPLNRSRKGAG